MKEREESIKRKGKASWGDLERGGGAQREKAKLKKNNKTKSQKIQRSSLRRIWQRYTMPSVNSISRDNEPNRKIGIQKHSPRETKIKGNIARDVAKILNFIYMTSKCVCVRMSSV